MHIPWHLVAIFIATIVVCVLLQWYLFRRRLRARFEMEVRARINAEIKRRVLAHLAGEAPLNKGPGTGK